MSRTEPKDIVKKFLIASAAGDGETKMGLMADDAVMFTPGAPKVPFNGRFEGKASILQAFANSSIIQFRQCSAPHIHR